MPADVRAIKNRIKSIESTLHITKAMQLVASSKIKRATEAYSHANEFAESYKRAYSALTTKDNSGSVFLKERTSLPSLFIIIAADRGLAGGYNGNVFRYCLSSIGENDYVLPIGKRSVDFAVKKYINVLTTEYDSSEKISDVQIKDITDRLIKEFTEGKIGTISVISTEFVSIVTQEVRQERLLPLSVSESGIRVCTVYEPDTASVMSYAIRGYVSAMISAHVRESYLCELYARRNAMDSATENAEEMIAAQNLIYNRARQSNITQEITEIVAGAEDR